MPQTTKQLLKAAAALSLDIFLLYLLVDRLRMYYLEAATLSFLFGALTSYYLGSWWIFADQKKGARNIDGSILVAMVALSFAINIMIIAAIIEFFDGSYLVGKLLATILVIIWSFLVRKQVANF